MPRFIPVLEKIREEQGRKRPWVANQIGVSRHSVENWEKGESMIPYDKARLLANLYGVKMEELYEEIKEPPE